MPSRACPARDRLRGPDCRRARSRTRADSEWRRAMSHQEGFRPSFRQFPPCDRTAPAEIGSAKLVPYDEDPKTLQERDRGAGGVRGRWGVLLPGETYAAESARLTTASSPRVLRVSTQSRTSRTSAAALPAGACSVTPRPAAKASIWSDRSATVTSHTPPMSWSARNAFDVRLVRPPAGHWLSTNVNGLLRSLRYFSVGFMASTSAMLGRSGRRHRFASRMAAAAALSSAPG